MAKQELFGENTRENIYHCIKCGLCIAHCPVYKEVPMEEASPRGKVQLSRHLSEGSLEYGRKVHDRLVPVEELREEDRRKSESQITCLAGMFAERDGSWLQPARGSKRSSPGAKPTVFRERTIGLVGFRHIVRHCLATADYAMDRLRAAGKLPWRHPNSITVVFERPSLQLSQKWQLAAHHDLAHVITMPQVTKEQIDRLAADLAADRPAVVVADQPEKIDARRDEPALRIGPQLKAMIDAAQSEVFMTSPYLVPGETGTKFLTALAQRGVSTRILTNSLAATDEAAAHSGYARYRRALLIARRASEPDSWVRQEIELALEPRAEAK